MEVKGVDQLLTDMTTLIENASFECPTRADAKVFAREALWMVLDAGWEPPSHADVMYEMLKELAGA